jgi:hypothetical protein
MICDHLRPLEQAIIACGIRETNRGKVWSLNCREWVYYHCFIDTSAVVQSLTLPACVVEYAHRGTHDGQERGFICNQCHDAVIGIYEPMPGFPIFKG